jgi:hypothetical protein
MRKIRQEELDMYERAGVVAQLRERLVDQFPEIAGRPGKVQITEAWEMSGGRVKVSGHVYSDAEGYWYFTRIINAQPRLP